MSLVMVLALCLATGVGGGRSAARPRPARIVLLAIDDPALRGSGGRYDQVHLGVGAASFGNVLVGVYGLWHNRGWGEDGTSCDLGLAVSNDGIHFREPVKAHAYISHRESPAPAVEGKNYPTILCQGNGILNVGDETRIYHGRWRNALGEDYYAEVALATLPRDRWGALGFFPDLPDHRDSRSRGESEGWVWSAPIEVPKGDWRLALNADHAGRMRVEVSDAQFNLLPGYSGEDSGLAQAPGGLECEIAWPGKDRLALGGQVVRFRVHLKRTNGADPRLYAIYLSSRP